MPTPFLRDPNLIATDAGFLRVEGQYIALHDAINLYQKHRKSNRYRIPVYYSSGNPYDYMLVTFEIVDEGRQIVCTIEEYVDGRASMMMGEEVTPREVEVPMRQMYSQAHRTPCVLWRDFRRIMEMGYDALLTEMMGRMKTSVRGVKFIICEEAPARLGEYTYHVGHDNDLSKVIGIRSHVLNDGNITIGIGTGIPVSDMARLTQYGLRGDMTHEQAQQHSIPIEYAIQLVMAAIEIREDKLNAFLTRNKIELTQQQYDALMSFSYNMRTGGTTLWDEIPDASGSAMVGFIRDGKGDYCPAEVDDLFNLYVNKGRRQREADLFNGKGYKFDNNAVLGWFRDSMIPGGRPQ
jgi:GH24 family phage-related lysozyme (muramidase)